jgi:DNA-directed RNA polymerase subunit RPC12/RpoP
MTPTDHTLQWSLEGGVQIYDNGTDLDDWLTMPVRCPSCGAEWQAVSAVGAMGIECPHCSHVDPFYVWRVPDNARDERTII